MSEYNPKRYAELLNATLPGIIETEEENEKALEEVNRLMSKGEENLSPEEDRLLRLLVRLIEDFESTAYPMDEESDPAVALGEIMRERNLKQMDMVDIFGSQGLVSQILNGKRSISKAQAKRLAAKFHMPVEVFI